MLAGARDRFTIGRLIRADRFGVVYEAVDSLGSRCYLKFVRRGPLGDCAQARFRSPARSLACAVVLIAFALSVFMLTLAVRVRVSGGG